MNGQRNGLRLKHDDPLLVRIAPAAESENTRDANGNTALIRACALGAVPEVLRMLQAGANPNLQNNLGETALHHAANELLCALLLRFGATANSVALHGETPLHRMVQRQEAKIVAVLLRGAAIVDTTDEEGDTPLHYAVRGGSFPIVCTLLGAGANPCFPNEDGETPLHLAATFGEAGICAALLKAGAHVTVADKSGATAADEAKSNGHITVLSLLLAARGVPLDKAIAPQSRLQATWPSCSQQLV